MARRPNRRLPSKEALRTRVAIYVRVSTEEQVEGYSLSAQERAIDAFCQSKEWEIVARYRDEGKSARTDILTKRPAFAQMLSDADAGRFDVIVVHKLDRFARNIRVMLDTLTQLEGAEVAFVSISENMDFTTPIGRVILATLSAFAQYYSDNLATETSKGKQERKRQGFYNGVLPFGVAKGEGGVPTLDTKPRWQSSDGSPLAPAHGLQLAFDLAAEGKAHREIAQSLNLAGYRTTGNRGENAFTKDSVRVILANRFYLGELPDGDGGSLPGKHGELIDRSLFDRVQALRERNLCRPRRVSTMRTPWALSGVATCGDCGQPLTLVGSGARRRAHCSGRRQGNGCDAPTVSVEAVEDQIGSLLNGFSAPVATRERLMHAWRRNRSRHIDVNAERIRLRSKLERLSELYVEGAIDRTAYDAQRETVLAQLASLPANTDPTDEAGRLLADYLADIGRAWSVATGDERNQIARQLFIDVLVINKTAVAIMPRPEFRPFLELAQADAQIYDDLSSVISLRRKRRGSLAPYRHFPEDAVILSTTSATLQRYTEPRPAKLSTSDVAAIKRLVDSGRTLRDVAVEFGVSAERVRQITSTGKQKVLYAD